ncbi:MAG TPA: type VI secretion system membrane subunit TssM [Burkholderiaceae bacterium]|nr:type VI secretion system membrane subunit TssM [Burkholderiaceae bacterium]
MTKLLRWIVNRWVLAALGLLALGLLIWFGGPLLAIADYRPLSSEGARAFLIALLLVFYFGRLGWRAWRSHRANASLLEGLAAPARDAPKEEPEVAVLRTRFQEALAVLKQMQRGERKTMTDWLQALRPGRHLYELPWYVFIGAPGSGKTTALLNSGLRFPLADKFGEPKVQGVGGTRNCDWWFTDDAVLIDTAGRYTTQDSDRTTDAAAWQGFLSLLKKHRPRCPLNGVILTVSAADLLSHTGSARGTEADAIRKRVHELQSSFGITLPIYVLVTKADLMAGFTEFFADLGKEERGQVWGFTAPQPTPQEAPAVLVQFGAEFDALEKRLHERLIDRVQSERDPRRRALIYSFPQQFAVLREPLHALLQEAFAPSRFSGATRLRGVYLTSGTQEGSPLDRALGNMGRMMGLEQKLLPPQRSSGRSYFLQRLLHDVVFAEAALTGSNPRWERRRTLIRLGALAATLVAALALATAWAVSYTRNRAYVAEVARRIAPVTQMVQVIGVGQDSSILPVLPVLDAMRALAITPGAERDRVPWSMGFGLFQGDKLEAAVDNTYARLLRDAFLPRLSRRIEDLLRAGAQNPDQLYEALKAYLMLYDPERMQPQVFKRFVTADWDQNLAQSLPASQRPAAEAHLDAMLERHRDLPALRVDPALVATARAKLAGQPITERVYVRLRRQGVGADAPDFTIAAKVGAAAPLMFARQSGKPVTDGVPGLFTLAGYAAFGSAVERVSQELGEEEPWVLGTRTEPLDLRRRQQIADEVRRLYLEDYAATWQAFIRDIRLVRARDVQQSIDLARLLSAPDSPLPVLLRAIVKEVTLVRRDDADKSLLERGIDLSTKQVEKLTKKVPGKAPPPTARELMTPEQIVDARFEELRAFVRGPEGKAPVDLVGPLMQEIYNYLLAVDAAQKQKLNPPESAAPLKLKAGAASMPEPVRSALNDLSEVALRGVQQQTRANLTEKLAQIAEFCVRAINGRYPFVKSSDRDVTQEDFARLFSPGGLYDEFIQRELVQHVDFGTRPWTFRRIAGQVGGDTSPGLIQLQRAQSIRDVFFRGGARTLSLRFDFKPIEMDASITQFLLDVDGQILRYAHGPQQLTPVRWPGPRGTSQVRLEIEPKRVGADAGMLFEGPWALFRLLDRAQIDAGPQPERFNVTFRVDGRKTVFEVSASSVQNPFRLGELEQFQCPPRI